MLALAHCLQPSQNSFCGTPDRNIECLEFPSFDPDPNKVEDRAQRGADGFVEEGTDLFLQVGGSAIEKA
jgi:hypothetical protein